MFATDPKPNDVKFRYIGASWFGVHDLFSRRRVWLSMCQYVQQFIKTPDSRNLRLRLKADTWSKQQIASGPAHGQLTTEGPHRGPTIIVAVHFWFGGRAHGAILLHARAERCGGFPTRLDAMYDERL